MDTSPTAETPVSCHAPTHRGLAPVARSTRRAWPGAIGALGALAAFAALSTPLAAQAQAVSHPPRSVALAAPALPAAAVPAALPAPSLPAAPEPELRAQLTPLRYTTLAAEIGARIERLATTEGGVIRAGEVLVRFDCSLQRAQLDRAAATLGAAEKLLATQRRLVELNATGRQEVDQAEAEVAKTRAEAAQIQVQLGKCEVVAPFDGRVAEQKVREQQYVQPGQTLLEVLDDGALEVEFIMPSRWLRNVRVGSAVQIAVDETGRAYPARVQRLGARVDPISQSVKVIAAIDGRHADLMAGMSGRVLIKRSP
jgi:RND family efflux transporter MFP subunit